MLVQIKDVIVKTLLAVEPHINVNMLKNSTTRNSCFEIYGFDVILDETFKPWVLEVNVLPSLSSSSPFDKRIKTMLVCDALTLVGVRGYDKSRIQNETLSMPPFHQSMTLEEPKYKKQELSGDEKLSRDELEMIIELEEEFSRKGHF